MLPTLLAKAGHCDTPCDTRWSSRAPSEAHLRLAGTAPTPGRGVPTPVLPPLFAKAGQRDAPRDTRWSSRAPSEAHLRLAGTAPTPGRNAPTAAVLLERTHDLAPCSRACGPFRHGTELRCVLHTLDAAAQPALLATGCRTLRAHITMRRSHMKGTLRSELARTRTSPASPLLIGAQPMPNHEPA